MKRRILIALTMIACALLVVPTATPKQAEAQEQEEITLRIATLAPRGSAWARIFNAWKRTLRRETDDKLKLRFYFGGTQGNESDFVRKMGAGQLDGAAVTTNGLGQIARPVLVLALPGLFSSNRQIDNVRSSMASDFDTLFEQAGYHNCGWGDVGAARFFSNRPINTPQDLAATKPWAQADNPIAGALYSAAGANGVELGVPEVYPALQTGMVDAFPGSALAASALMWSSRVTHVTQQSDSVLVGATVLKKERYDALPEALRTAFDTTSAQAHRQLVRRIRRADTEAYDAIVAGGVTPVDISGNQAAWRRVAEQVQSRLAGRVYPQSLLDQVKAAR